jgi:hypothetical protein
MDEEKTPESKSKSSDHIPTPVPAISPDPVQPSSQTTWWEKSPKRTDYAGRIIWALFLIFVGTVLLFNTLGVVSWQVWGYLINFWPLILVMLGLRIILGSSPWAGLFLGVVGLAIMGFLFLAGLQLINSPLLSRWNISLPSWWAEATTNLGETKQLDYQLDQSKYPNIEERKLEINAGIGEFELKSSADDELLVLDANYYAQFGDPKIQETEVNKVLSIKFDQNKEDGYTTFPAKTPSYDFKIGSPELLTDLVINLGAGYGNVDLDKNKIDELKLDVGAGQLDITLEEDAIPAKEITIHVGAGSVNLTIPAAVGYRVDYSVGLGAVELEDEEFGGIGNNNDNYQSDDYATSKMKVNIKVEVGVGRFELNR